jgi:hypothetical protein
MKKYEPNKNSKPGTQGSYKMFLSTLNWNQGIYRNKEENRLETSSYHVG